MRTLYYQGRIVAKSKNGKWIPEGDVPLIEQGAAFKHGEVISDFTAPETHNPATGLMILAFSVLFLVLFITKLAGQW